MTLRLIRQVTRREVQSPHRTAKLSYLIKGKGRQAQGTPTLSRHPIQENPVTVDLVSKIKHRKKKLVNR